MIQPHGGTLVERKLDKSRAEEIRKKAAEMKRIVLDSELVSDVENIATGVYSPLEGFLNEKDF